MSTFSAAITSPAFIQFIKYALAGVLATVVHISIFHLVCWRIFPALQEKDTIVRFLRLTPVIVDPATRAKNSIYGNIIAFLIANVVAYVTNILWVFEAGRYSFTVEFLLFCAVSGFSTFVGTALMGTLIYRFHILTTWALCVNIFCSVMINYAIRKFFIFAG